MQVKDVKLTIGSESDDKRKATVSYKLAFDDAEAGNTYKVAITLRGEDLSGDDETASQGPSNPLYTFRFGSGFIKLPYTTVTAEAGEKSYSYSRDVASDTLDEDPGFHSIEVSINDTLQIPHGDEIYAQVVASDEARSTTVKFPLGV